MSFSATLYYWYMKLHSRDGFFEGAVFEYALFNVHSQVFWNKAITKYPNTTQCFSNFIEYASIYGNTSILEALLERYSREDVLNALNNIEHIVHPLIVNWILRNSDKHYETCRQNHILLLVHHLRNSKYTVFLKLGPVFFNWVDAWLLFSDAQSENDHATALKIIQFCGMKLNSLLGQCDSIKKERYPTLSRKEKKYTERLQKTIDILIKHFSMHSSIVYAILGRVDYNVCTDPYLCAIALHAQTGPNCIMHLGGNCIAQLSKQEIVKLERSADCLLLDMLRWDDSSYNADAVYQYAVCIGTKTCGETDTLALEYEHTLYECNIM